MLRHSLQKYFKSNTTQVLKSVSCPHSSRWIYYKCKIHSDARIPVLTTSRHLFSFSGPSFSKRKEYHAKKIVGYTPIQMYNVISDVGSYKEFLPFCTKSEILLKGDNYLKGNLEIGFPPLKENYISHVTLKPYELIRAEASDCKIFDYLVNVWKLEEGMKDVPNSSHVSFYLTFQFKSILHAKMINLIFNQLVHQMEDSFSKEARRRYGTPSFVTRTVYTTST